MALNEKIHSVSLAPAGAVQHKQHRHVDPYWKPVKKATGRKLSPAEIEFEKQRMGTIAAPDYFKKSMFHEDRVTKVLIEIVKQRIQGKTNQ